MWLSIQASHILVAILVILNVLCLPLTSNGLPIRPTSSDQSVARPSKSEHIELVNLLPLERRIRLAEGEDDDDDKDKDKPDEAKEEDKADEEKKEEVDEDLKSDEETDDKDDDDDDDDKKEDDNAAEEDDDDDVKSQADHKLLIILVDGFRHDYVTRDKALKGFPRMAKQGVHAKEVTPVHPSKSYPNYYSILTGLYPENHGFIDNYIRDKPTGEIFLGSPHPNASNAHWWIDAEPLWWTAEKHRIKTAVYGWDGCQVRTENNKKRPPLHVCEPYAGYPGARKEKERFRGWLERITEDFANHKYRLALAYYESVDSTGHKFGPQSKMTKQAVRDIDEILYDLQDMIIKKDLDDEVNVYVVSDHGMIDTKKFKEIELDDYIDMNDVELILGAGPTVQLLAEKDKHSEIYNKLLQANIKGLNVYKKSTIPERFHLRGDSNLLPIYLTADRGYQIVPPHINAKVYPDMDVDDDGDIELSRGNHGYDPDFVEEMDGIMYAYGPDIRDGEVIEEMDMVDHYGVFCQLLGLEPKPNNGSTEMYDEILNKFGDSSSEEEDADKDGKEDDDDDDDSGEEEGKGKKDDDDDDDDDDNGALRAGAHWISLLFSLAVAVLLQFSC